MQKIVIFGLGISAIATTNFFLSNGYEVIISNDNKNDIDLFPNKINNISKDNLILYHDISIIPWKDIKYLVLAPSVPLQYPKPHEIVILARQNNVKILCDIELFYLFNNKANFLAITGTNGKSTTTSLIGHILKENNIKNEIGGNIGIASFCLSRFKSDGNYVLELSSYQLDLIHQARFNIASLINITPDHLEHHGNMKNYIEAKKKIFLNQKKGDFAIINIDNNITNNIYQDLKNDSKFEANLIEISTKKNVTKGISIIDNKVTNNIEDKEQFELENLPFLQGKHNKENIAFAFANAFLKKIKSQDIINSITTFQGVKHRMQFIGEVNNIIFINDSKATNINSTKCALESYDNIYWILGGKQKNDNILDLKKYFTKIKYTFLIGSSSDEFANLLEGKLNYCKCNSLENAFYKAYNKAKIDSINNKSVVMLSPACASFDQWKNFEERGDYFCKLFKTLL